MADMIVAGAGTSEVNGTYTYYSTVNSKPRYNKSGTDLSIWWYSIFTFKYWQLVDNTNKYYRSYDNVATPDLCTTWVAVDGAEPVPTVTADSGGATGALRRTNMNAQMQSLTGGFN